MPIIKVNRDKLFTQISTIFFVPIRVIRVLFLYFVQALINPFVLIRVIRVFHLHLKQTLNFSFPPLLKSLSASFFCLILFHQITIGQENKFDISGFARIDHYFTFKYYKDPIINERNQGLLQANISKKFIDKIKIFTALEFRGDLSAPSRNRIYPKEYYVNLSLKSFDFRIGKQIYFWGRADGVNVTNNICPVDYTDFLDADDEKIGQLSLNTKYYLKNWTLQGVYIPFFSTSILPVKNSIWNLPLPAVIESPCGKYFIPVFNYLPDYAPDKNLKNGQYAFKLDKQGSGFDLSTSYYHGYSHLPEITKSFSFLNFDSVKVNIQKNYLPKDIIGFDFATTLGKFGIRGEGAYFMTSGKQAKLIKYQYDYLQYALGVDFRKDINNNNFYFIVQWMQEIVPSGNKYPLTSFNHLFQKSLLARVEFNSRNILSASMQALYDFEFKDYYLRPHINYKIFDGLELSLIGDILNGDDRSLFGIYKFNDRIQMKAKYSF